MNLLPQVLFCNFCKVKKSLLFDDRYINKFVLQSLSIYISPFYCKKNLFQQILKKSFWCAYLLLKKPFSSSHIVDNGCAAQGNVTATMQCLFFSCYIEHACIAEVKIWCQKSLD